VSILKPEASIGIGLATAGLVGYIYSKGMPSVADIRVADSQDKDINSVNRQALWTSAGVVGAVSLIAKDPTIFILGGAMAVTLYWVHAHANLVDNITGKATQGGLSVVPDMPSETQEQIPDAFGYGGDIS
jgi:hypothetical protein